MDRNNIDNNIQVDRRFAEQQLIHICAKTMSHMSDIFQWQSRAVDVTNKFHRIIFYVSAILIIYNYDFVCICCSSWSVDCPYLQSMVIHNHGCPQVDHAYLFSLYRKPCIRFLRIDIKVIEYDAHTAPCDEL